VIGLDGGVGDSSCVRDARGAQLPASTQVQVDLEDRRMRSRPSRSSRDLSCSWVRLAASPPDRKAIRPSKRTFEAEEASPDASARGCSPNLGQPRVRPLEARPHPPIGSLARRTGSTSSAVSVMNLVLLASEWLSTTRSCSRFPPRHRQLGFSAAAAGFLSLSGRDPSALLQRPPGSKSWCA
jgi:hypothetical protein